MVAFRMFQDWRFAKKNETIQLNQIAPCTCVIDLFSVSFLFFPYRQSSLRLFETAHRGIDATHRK
jgi:hypothetical protein